MIKPKQNQHLLSTENQNFIVPNVIQCYKRLSWIEILGRHKTTLDISLLLIAWISLILLINPVGDFPLNDDWSYGRAAMIIAKGGGFHPTDWTAMTLLTQALWGALFCLPFGFSFTALRASTLTLSFLCIMCTYLLLRNISNNRWIGLLGAMGVMANPLYLSMSFTFMNDVPSMAFAIFSIYSLVRYLQTDQDWWYIIGIAWVIIGVLCRQVNIYTALALPIPYLIRREFSLKALVRAFLPIILGILALKLFEFWLTQTSVLPAHYVAKSISFTKSILHPKFLVIYRNSMEILFYLGIFLFPLIIGGYGLRKVNSFGRGKALFTGIILLFFSALSLSYIYKQGEIMPLSVNVLVKGGIGPHLLHDTLILSLPHYPPLPHKFWLGVTILGVVGGAIIISNLIFALIYIFNPSVNKTAKAVILFLFLCAIIYSYPMVSRNFYDRYLISLIPLISIFILVNNKPETSKTSNIFLLFTGFLIITMMIFSTAATRDYLTWNRVRWQALNYLTQERSIKPEKIDGGFEFNSWHLYDSTFVQEPRSRPKSWWWVHEDEFMITMGHVDGYRVVKKYSYQRWLYPQKSHIYILRLLKNPLQ